MANILCSFDLTISVQVDIFKAFSSNLPIYVNLGMLKWETFFYFCGAQKYLQLMLMITSPLCAVTATRRNLKKYQSDNVNTSHPTLSRQCVPLCYWKWRWKVLAWLRISLILAACWSAKSVLMAHSINWIRFNAVPDSSQRLAVKNGLLISVIHGAGDITASSKRLIFSEKPPLLICHRNTLPDFFKGTFLWMKI